MPAVFAAVALLVWRARRGPLGGAPAAFVVAVGLGLLIATSLLGLFTDVDVAGGDLKPMQTELAWVTVGLLALGALVAVGVFWLMNSGHPVKVALGAGLAFLPAMYWIGDLVWGVAGDGDLAGSPYLSLIVAGAGVGVALGYCGWRSASRVAAWVAVLLLMTAGVALVEWAQMVLATGSAEYTGFVFLQSLTFNAWAAGTALLVGVAVALSRRSPAVDPS